MPFKTNLQNIVFYLGVGLLLTHQMDAALNSEWRVLPLLSWMSDEYGQVVFLLLHIPLFAILIGLIASPISWLRMATHLGIAAYLVIHAMLHMRLVGSETYVFSSLLSNAFIYGAALCGVAYFVLLIRDYVRSLGDAKEEEAGAPAILENKAGEDKREKADSEKS